MNYRLRIRDRPTCSKLRQRKRKISEMSWVISSKSIKCARKSIDRTRILSPRVVLFHLRLRDWKRITRNIRIRLINLPKKNNSWLDKQHNKLKVWDSIDHRRSFSNSQRKRPSHRLELQALLLIQNLQLKNLRQSNHHLKSKLQLRRSSLQKRLQALRLRVVLLKLNQIRSHQKLI